VRFHSFTGKNALSLFEGLLPWEGISKGGRGWGDVSPAFASERRSAFPLYSIVRQRKDIFCNCGDGKLQSAFQKLRQRCGHSPSGVKTPYYAGLFGTAEAVPCYKTGD
jgi:hypothetical protein